VFTENMEELHVEIDMHDSKWAIREDERHSIDLPALPDVADIATPVGIALLADKVPMPLDVARALFRLDGSIDLGSAALSVFESRLRLPARAIVELVRHNGQERIGSAKDTVFDHVHDRVNQASARLLAALRGHVRSDVPIPDEVRDMFEQTQARRDRADDEPDALSDAHDIALDDGDSVTMLSPLAQPVVELDALPADLRARSDMA